MLKVCGVDVIFGISGVYNVEMYCGIEEVGIIYVFVCYE